MKPLVVASVPAVVVFVGAEVVCRLLLHLPDGTVPLVVLPLTGLAAVLTITVRRRRAADEGRPPRT